MNRRLPGEVNEPPRTVGVVSPQDGAAQGGSVTALGESNDGEVGGSLTSPAVSPGQTREGGAEKALALAVRSLVRFGIHIPPHECASGRGPCTCGFEAAVAAISEAAAALARGDTDGLPPTEVELGLTRPLDEVLAEIDAEEEAAKSGAAGGGVERLSTDKEDE